jgi:hypothetical protein
VLLAIREALREAPSSKRRANLNSLGKEHGTDRRRTP